jgi:DNA-binding transcriptional LysR family regulator
MLDVGRLRFFREVVRAGSFSEAASRLSYTQSAVSQQIATLEAELGLTLIERRTRPLRLTDAGETLLRRAETIAGEVATAEAELRAIAKLDSGLLRLGGFSSACATILPMAVARFLREHPGVTVTLSELEVQAAQSSLRAGEIDLALTYEYPHTEPAHADGLQRTALGEDYLIIAMPASHPLARQQSLCLKQLHHERWVSTPTSGPTAQHRRFVEESCARAGFQPDIHYEIRDIWTAFGLIAAGLAIGLMPTLACLAPHPAIATRPLVDSISPFRHVFAVHVAQRRLPGIQPMLDILQRDIPPQLADSPTRRSQPSALTDTENR